MSEILPPMIKCHECIFARSYFDSFLKEIGYRCSKMSMVGEFGDEYSLQNTACTEGIKKGDCLSINSKVHNNRPK